jgi:hypothetical protein
MESKNNIIKIAVGSIGFGLLTLVASFFKMNHIVGSHASYFSVATAITPLAGLQGISFGCITFLLMTFIKVLLGANPIFYVVYHIPSLCGALYWSRLQPFFSLILPLVCMVLFVVHPQGAGAWTYTLYWLIPD